MESDPEHAIPAANIGDTDLVALSRTNAAAAKEIARLEALMGRGDETKDEFRRLCELLFEFGSRPAAEYLLRRNLEYYEGASLYHRLFGTVKQDEFNGAIAAFKTQFGVELVPVKQPSFLISKFRCRGGAPRSDEFALLSRRCDVEIAYIEQDVIEADVVLDAPERDFSNEVCDDDECLLLYFVDGVWKKTHRIMLG